MDTEIAPALSCPCSITLRPHGTFSIGGGSRGGFSKNVLSKLRPGSFYTMVFDPISKKLTVELADPTPLSP